jgi:hypothetical protein
MVQMKENGSKVEKKGPVIGCKCCSRTEDVNINGFCCLCRSNAMKQFGFDGFIMTNFRGVQLG